MKKTSEPFAGVKHDHSEVSRRLYKGALDTARRLEERIRAVSSLQELLGPEVTALRTRLKDYCERLMFSDPVEYGRKAEELMWRKVYYEIIQLSKQHQKKLVTEGNEELSRHLLAGMGSYQHLLLRLQTEFYLDLEGNVDVPFIWQQKGTKKEKWKKRQKDREVEEPVQEWCRQACHHFLICLGDLARYTSDLGYEENVHLAKRYYYQAFAVEPSMGMPHNQLGTLTAMTAGGCNAAYHYLRCLQSPKPFEGAEGNLQRVFEKNIQTFKELDNTEERDGELVTRRFLARFLKLCEDFLICQEENIESLCQDILQDFHHCVTSIQYSQDEDEGVEQLDSSLIFKLTMMTVMCAHRLQTTGSPLISTATAFLLTYFSHQCCYCVQRLQSALFPFSISAHPFNNYEDTDTRSTSATATPVPPTEDNCAIVESTTEYNDKRFVKRKIKERSLSRRRVSRRRKQSSTSQEDSELSEGHSESDLEEKNSSDTASCTSGSITEHGVEEEELSDCGEHSGLGVENVTSTAVDCNGELEENLTSNKAVLQNGLDCISKSTTSVSQEDKDNTENEHLSNGDVQNKSEGSYSVSGIVTPQSLVEQELTPSVVEVIKIINQEGLLPGIKVVADWLIINSDIIVTYGESCQILWSHVINLLNLLKKVHDKLKNDASPPSVQGFVWNGPEWKQTQPLPEDFTLHVG
ncbi:nonsense-mediated mRNA decay factor SMG5-like isoform X1 [Tachypleus tridentatus]|uniref:nonsense-mediated mRNA decay factor SMG5-like isoform X1 n=2 Tax=Tachypleus tridentatus TaxID=6853 RepID=UPI003FD23572